MQPIHPCLGSGPRDSTTRSRQRETNHAVDDKVSLRTGLKAYSHRSKARSEKDQRKCSLPLGVNGASNRGRRRGQVPPCISYLWKSAAKISIIKVQKCEFVLRSLVLFIAEWRKNFCCCCYWLLFSLSTSKIADSWQYILCTREGNNCIKGSINVCCIRQMWVSTGQITKHRLNHEQLKLKLNVLRYSNCEAKSGN